ncbi:phosphohistidine phosphatase SixA [Salinicola rhizosphaerae]|nr:phosphohistidine phosphatase SixA [Salinicola rhizosphaerae]
MGYLAIVRHGEAAMGHPDAERRLTRRGEVEAASAGAWLAACPELAKAQLWSSPFARARQTASAVSQATGLECETVDGVTPDDDVDSLIERLTGHAPSTPLIIVSHMPLVGLLAGRLIEGPASHGVAFPTAGIALLEGDVWAAGCARLAAFIAPPHQ